MSEDEQPLTQATHLWTGDMPDDEMPDDEIDQNLAESFPASDPPSWTLGTDPRTKRDDGGREQVPG